MKWNDKKWNDIKKDPKGNRIKWNEIIIETIQNKTL